jgi:hypothetical protein
LAAQAIPYAANNQRPHGALVSLGLPFELAMKRLGHINGHAHDLSIVQYEHRGSKTMLKICELVAVSG